MVDVRRAAMASLSLAAAMVAIAGCKPGASNAATSSGGAFWPVSAPGGPASGTTTFTDPTENAFTIQVPQGWSVKGGVQRASPTAATPWISATSPDGATVISIGDPSIPSFILPSPYHAAGSTVQNAAGSVSAVEPYESGVQFAGDYAQRAYAQTCAPLQPAGSQPEPDFVQMAQDQMAKIAAAVGVPPPPANYDGGSARFTCQANGAADTVGVIDVTAVNQSSAGGFWNVPILIAYRTPAASQAQTDQIARAMRQSYQPNAQWQAQMVTATRQQLASIQQQGQQQMAQLRSQEAASGAMLNAQMQSADARLNAEHSQTMNWLNAQGQRINQNFANQQYDKETGQQSEMRYINNQSCIAWYDAAHTRCKATASN
jgi:hypothetical protein